MKDNVIVIRGELHWAKVLGDARPYDGNPKYDKGPYWSIDVTPNAESRKLIKQFGIESKLRDPKKSKSEKEKRTETFLTLKVLENRADGKKNDSPTVKDIRGNDWDQNVLIGNGSVGDVKIKIKDYGAGVEKGVYLQALRILKLVPYEDVAFEALSEDDEFFASDEDLGQPEPTAGPVEDLSADDADMDDDIPF